MAKLTKLFKNTDIKIAYKTNKNNLQKLNNPHNKDNTTTNGIYKIECQDYNKYYIGQTKKQLKKRYFEHLNAYKKPEIYKSNLATPAINTGHEFPDMTLIKHIPHTGTIINVWENLQICTNTKQTNT